MPNKSASVTLTLKITSFIVRLLLNIIFYILVVIMIVSFSKKAYEFTYQLYGPVAVASEANAQRVILQIKKGDSSMDVASKLENLRAIKNKFSFYLKMKLEHYVIMPGTFELYTDMTYDEILAIITDYSASIIKEEDTEEEDGTSSGGDTTTPGHDTTASPGSDAGSDAGTEAGSETDGETGGGTQ